MLDISLDYYWELTYTDGTKLTQINAEGVEQALDVKAVSEKRIAKAAWHPVDPTRKAAVLEIPEGSKLIIFTRKYLSPNEQINYRTYIIGHEWHNDEDRVEKRLTFIQPGCTANKTHLGKDGKTYKTTHRFPGAVETVTDSEAEVAYAKWCASVSAYNPENSGAV
jgi:hypothetical protein